MNGMIGNGNDVASDWMNLWGSGDHPPLLRLLDLTCAGDGRAQHCRFDLLREGGPIVAQGRRIPDRIECSAPIKPSPGAEGTWGIPHLRPGPDGGHSRTTMKCRWAAN